ncbi:capsid maturation protease [Microbacterium Phage DejaVu]|nr:capsid maturation protease [Microbacterium phage Roman]QIG58581.1 capsid maturation protease [Microbacterium phage Hubbs]UVG34091.1 capsid maturation protease [Microbacterium phage Pavlo]WNM66169.1 capsid maturation protease [Microbacterium Phage DejaVu]
MTKKILQESSSLPTATGERGVWRATLITPGLGSSGNWLEETLRRDGPVALRKGAKCFVTHNRLENGEPDPFRMWATLDTDPWYEEGVGLVSDIRVLKSWIDKVEEVAPHTALSVFLMAEADEYNNVTAILPDIQNGVDMVVYPGREGSALVEKLYESARMESQKNPAVKSAVENEPKGLSLMEKDVQDRFDAIDAKIDSALGSKQVEAEAKATEDAIAAAVDKAIKDHAEKAKTALAAVEAAKADLLPSQVATLTESALKGEDVTASIESSKAIAAEAKKHFVEANKDDDEGRETGRLGESALEDYEFSGFTTSKKGA